MPTPGLGIGSDPALGLGPLSRVMAREIWRIKAMFDDGPVNQLVFILQQKQK